jgi:Na+/H+ antiporter NhaC
MKNTLYGVLFAWSVVAVIISIFAGGIWLIDHGHTIAPFAFLALLLTATGAFIGSQWNSK